MKNLVRTSIFLTFLVFVVACSQSEQHPEIEPSAATKKYIDLSGYAHPNVAFIRQNLTAMEANKPFDGIVFRVDPVNGFNSNLTPTLLEPVAWNASNINFTTLANIPWKKFTNNFIRLDTTDGSYDPEWFNDVRWNTVANNMKLFARIAKVSKSKGIVFDNEPYGYNPWDYSTAEYPGKTFAQVYAQVRKRGAQVMNAWQNEYPNITVLNLFGLAIVRAQTDYYGGDQSKAEWGLWGAFIEGMLDVISPTAKLIEGNEGSYYYTKDTDFSSFRNYKYGARNLLSLENRSKYDRQMKIAYAVYVDGVLDLWKSPRFFGYYFASEAERRRYAQHNFYHALKNTDEYVWVYSENMDWWGVKGQGVSVPGSLPGIMRLAKDKITNAQPLGFSITAAVDKAAAEYARRIFVSGKIFKRGKTFNVRLYSGPPIGIEAEDSACNTYYSDETFFTYDCVFPYGWSGSLTPTSSEMSFTPVKRTYTNLTDNVSVNYSAR
jgi:hypothetical protein